MNAKEKLEEINHILNIFKGCIEELDDSNDCLDMNRFDEILSNMYEDNILKDFYRFSKNNYERVQELEKANKTLSDNHFQQIEQHKYLVKQNKRYRSLIERIQKMTIYDDCREAEIYELVTDELESDK